MHEIDTPDGPLAPPAPAIVDPAALGVVLGGTIQGLHCRLWRVGADWSIPARTLANDFLFLPLAGGVALRAGAGEERLLPGSLALVPAGRVHSARLLPPHRRLLVLAGHARLHDAAGLPLLTALGRSVHPLPAGADWPALLHTAAALAGSDPAAAAQHLAAIWRLLLAQLVIGGLCLPPAVAAADARIARALALVHARPGDPHTVASLAQAVGLRPVRFRSLFAAACGCAPKGYLDRLRIAQAKHLLRSSSMPAAEIARACGFGHPRHFLARFRSMTGCTPGAWRRGGGAPEP